MTSPTKSQVLAIAPKFTAFLSMCGSLGIILKVLFNARRREKTMHRIVMGMSVCDFLASIWYFTGTWAIPAGTLSWFGDGETETIYWAAGDPNGVSCSFAGYFNQFAVATPLYNCSLGVFYLLVVNYGWKDYRIVKIEWLFHAIPVGYAFFTSTFAVAANLYGHVEWTCWVLPGALFDETQELTPIQSKFQWIQWIFLFGVVWTCIFVLTVIFVILYRKMKVLERKMKRHTYNSTHSSSFNYRSGVTSGSMDSRMLSSKGEVHSIEMSSAQLMIDNRTERFRKSNIEEDAGTVESETAESAPKLNIEEKIDNPSFDENKDIETDENVSEADIEEGDDISLPGEDSEDADRTVESHSVKENDAKISDDDEHNRQKMAQKHIDAVNAIIIETSKKMAPALENGERDRSTRIVQMCNLNGSNGDDDLRDSSRPRRARKEAAKSMKIAVQGLLYVGAFYITWLFPTISRITELVAKKNYFPIQFLDTFLIPLQGFFNFFIYVRPRFMDYRRRNKDDGFWRSITSVVFEVKID